MLGDIVSRQGAITRLITSTTTLVQQLEPILVNDRPEIEQLLTNLSAMTSMIERHDDLLRNILQILPVPWGLFANATGTGDELVGERLRTERSSTRTCVRSANGPSKCICPPISRTANEADRSRSQKAGRRRGGRVVAGYAGATGLRHDSIAVTAEFENANGLYAGNAVEVLGMQVGKVTGIKARNRRRCDHVGRQLGAHARQGTGGDLGLDPDRSPRGIRAGLPR